jgi:hypothetical protein
MDNPSEGAASNASNQNLGRTDERGSRLIEHALGRDLDGQTRLEFAPEGVHCWITAVLAPAETALQNKHSAEVL